MHPSGYQLASSFIDKIWIHHILHDELRPSRFIEIRNAQIIKYSKGGHLFIAIEKQKTEEDEEVTPININRNKKSSSDSEERQTINIYNAYTL